MYQDIEKAPVSISRPAAGADDLKAQAQIDQLYGYYQRLAKQVFNCQSVVCNFAVTVANGLTTLAITLPFTYPDTQYVVNAQFNFNNGGWWVTGKTRTGFTLNWATASVGAQAVRFLIVD